MSKYEPKKTKAHEQFPEIEKHQKRINIATIETVSIFPIQKLMCREEHKKLLEDLWKNPN